MEISSRVTGLERDVENLKGWQKTQNTDILRVEEKVDKLVFWMMTSSVIFSLGFLSNIVINIVK